MLWAIRAKAVEGVVKYIPHKQFQADRRPEGGGAWKRLWRSCVYRHHHAGFTTHQAAYQADKRAEVGRGLHRGYRGRQYLKGSREVSFRV